MNQTVTHGFNMSPFCVSSVGKILQGLGSLPRRQFRGPPVWACCFRGFHGMEFYLFIYHGGVVFSPLSGARRNGQMIELGAPS